MTRIILAGKNSELSRTAFQDQAKGLALTAPVKPLTEQKEAA